MARTLAFRAAVVLLCGLAVSSSQAQDSLLLELYGQGVHAYYAHDYTQTYDLLSKAIEQNTRDPRCYYFRGLAAEKLGRPDEAKADFEKGAELEAQGNAVQIDIGRSLQRIQGPIRLQLEQERYSAKLAASLDRSKQNQERYEQFQQDQGRVLRDPDRQPPEDVIAPPPAGDETDPFGGDGPAEAPAPAPADEPAPPSPADAPAAVDLFSEPAADDGPADPFGAAAEPAVMPSDGGAAADPFGAPAEPATPPEPAAADPFGAAAEPATPPAPAAADPFGAPAEPATPAAPAPAAADPFGAPAEPATPPAPAAADPFGAPAEPAAPANDNDVLGQEDPFGNPPPAASDSSSGEAADETENPFADDDSAGAQPSPPSPPLDDPFGN